MTDRYVRPAAAVGTGTGRAEWAPATQYVVGDRVVCRQAYATTARRLFVYECTSTSGTGTSHATTEPTWPSAVGNTVTDNPGADQVVWTCRAATTWANASLYLHYITAAPLVAPFSAGDHFWIDSSYAQVATGDITIGTTSWAPGDRTQPTHIISTSDTVNEPPQSMTAGATIRTSGSITFYIHAAHYHGINFEAGYGASSGTPTLGLHGAANSADNGEGAEWHACTFKLCYAVTDSYFRLGHSFLSTNYPAAAGRLFNCTFEFSHAGQYLALSHGPYEVIGGAILGVAPSTLCKFVGVSYSGNYRFTGMDLSLVSGNLVDATGMSSDHFLIFSRCKLHSSATPVVSPLGLYPQTNIIFELCDSGTANYKFYGQHYCGAVETETTYVKSGGASDGVTPISWKMTANSRNTQHGLTTPWVMTWLDAVNTPQTLTLDTLHDGAFGLWSHELFMEAVSLTTSGYPLGQLVRTRPSYIFSGTAVASSAALWETTGMTNPAPYKLSVVVTPQVKGLAAARLTLTRNNFTLYVDPRLAVS